MFDKEYLTSIKLINNCKSQSELGDIENRLGRLYSNGVFTQSQYVKLDGLCLDKFEELIEVEICSDCSILIN